ncbi:MAG: hypothetical protein U5M51_00750, partial [Emticicia sp.]|nr:hypothetical protein [Emticicia sp.]
QINLLAFLLQNLNFTKPSTLQNRQTMKYFFLLLICINLSFAQNLQPSQLPLYQEVKPSTDWLISQKNYTAEIYQANGGKDLVLSNGLLKRQIRISPNAATIDFKNLRTGEQFVRSVRPEARITIDWYKKYRPILNSDIIHLRRPNGRDWDGIMHVNPNLKEKGFVMLYNPLKESISRKINLPLYYTGLSDKVLVREKEGKSKNYTLNRSYEIEVEITIPAESFNWLVLE